MSANIRLAPHALVLAVVAPLLAGAVAGYFVRSAIEAPVQEGPKDIAPAASPTVSLPDAADSVARADVETLRARVRELEKLLNEREGDLARLASKSEQKPEAAESGEASGRQRPRESFRERMERMKTEEPERYAEMQKRHGEFRARLHADNEERGNFLASIDTSRMTEEQKAGHERLISIIQTLDASMDKIGPGAEVQMTDEERQEVFSAMRDVVPLMEQERQYILEEVGKEYGEDGPAFANYIEEIIANTTPLPRFGCGRGGPRPPRGGPGGPPPGGPQ